MKPRIAWFYALSVGLTCIVAGCACSAQRGLESRERIALRHGSSLLLLGLAVTVDHRPYDAISDRMSPGRLMFSVGDINDLKVRDEFAPPVAPGSTAERGWCYFVLKPGSYMLSTGSLSCSRLDDLWQGVDLRVEIPPGEPVVYAGTLQVQARGSKLLFGQTVMQTVGDKDLRLVDESGPAAEVAQRLAPDHVTMRTIMATRYRAPLEHAAGARLLVESAARMSQPNLANVAMENFASPGVVLLSTADGSGGPGAGAVVVVGAGLALVGAGIGAVIGSAEASSWREHFNTISAEIAAMQPERMLRQRLIAAGAGAAIDPWPESFWSDGPPPAASADQPLLHVRLQKIQIAPCHGRAGGAFCLQIWVRARLWDPAAGRWTQDRWVVSGSDKVREDLSPMVFAAAPPAQNFRLDRIKPPDGLAVVRGEVDAGLDAIVRSLMAP